MFHAFNFLLFGLLKSCSIEFATVQKRDAKTSSAQAATLKQRKEKNVEASVATGDDSKF